MPDDALLTSSHRAFLDGETDAEWGDSTGRATRSRIRQRVHTGLRDFTYLADPDRFDERDCENLWPEDNDDPPLEDVLAELIAFVYRMESDAFESIVEAGTRRGVERFSPDYGVDTVQIQITQRGPMLEEARQRLKADEPLSPTHLHILLERSEIPAEEIREHVQAHPAPTTRYR